MSPNQVAAETAALAAHLTGNTSAGMERLPTAPWAGLSSREVDVLRWVATGLTNAEVGERLFISPRTVNAHLTRIYSKLDVPSRGAAMRVALDHGLVLEADPVRRLG
jgi:DNA-binding CsgD family transcriptional regulator